LEIKEDGTFSLVERLGGNIPPYAILSHTWGTDEEEVSFKDLMDGRGESKPGYRKIRFCGRQAAKDGLGFFWVDTCCIDKSSSAELTEAVNSMFRWYQKSARCYVYLSDVDYPTLWKIQFRRSRWFTRGWTLQELIAPPLVEFFSGSKQRIGDRQSIVPILQEITGISFEALQGTPLSNFSVDERLSWAANRQTKREEDAAYCLLGIFDIHMPAIYGEGKKNALERLQRKIRKRISSSDFTGIPTPAARSPTLRDCPPGLARLSSSSSPPPIHPSHPVQGNYRKVHVAIIHWKTDRNDKIVADVSETFRSWYKYNVREIGLPLDTPQMKSLEWVWLESSQIDEKDLQILYYIGGTEKDPFSGRKDVMDIRACPDKQISANLARDLNSIPVNWLQSAIRIPNLTSDVLIILDCFIGGLSTGDVGGEAICYLLPDCDHSWARYGIILAAYSETGIRYNHTAFSGSLMLTLEDILPFHPGEYDPAFPESRYKPTHCNTVVNELQWYIEGAKDPMSAVFFGDSGIILSPIQE
jgi:hypothetical protein